MMICDVLMSYSFFILKFYMNIMSYNKKTEYG